MPLALISQASAQRVFICPKKKEAKIKKRKKKILSAAKINVSIAKRAQLITCQHERLLDVGGKRDRNFFSFVREAAA